MSHNTPTTLYINKIIQYIYTQHYNAKTNIVPSITKQDRDIYTTASKREFPEDVGLAPETHRQSRLIR